MRPTAKVSLGQIFGSIQYYLILSYAFESIGIVGAYNASDYMELAEKLLNVGKFIDALPHFHEAISNDPANYSTYFKRATVFLALSRPNLALEDLNRALELNPTFTSALRQRADLHVKMGNLDDAHVDYENLLKIEPDEKEAIEMNNKIDKLKDEIKNVQNQHDVAINVITPIIEVIPYNIKLLKMRANAYEKAGETGRAINDYRTIAKLGVDTSIYLTIAKLYYKMGDIEESLNNVSECLKLDPNHEACMNFHKSIKKTNTQSLRSRNYASSECAKVIESNPEAKKTSHIINEMIDEYMLNPCKTKIWFVIELCEIIQATQIEIASYELYSSTPKDFTVYFSDTYPALDWKPIGHFTATDSRTSQTFDLNQVGFGKFIRVELHSHYGSEHYCIVNEVKVFGDSMVDEYDKSEKSLDKDLNEANNLKQSNRKLKRRTSAYRVYRNMMVEPHVCGLSIDILNLNNLKNDTTGHHIFYPLKEQPVKPILPQPTQQPVVNNRTTPLKPSIFVELSNKVKALETSLKTQIEDIERRLSETLDVKRQTEARVDKLEMYFRSMAFFVGSYYVYKVMLELM